jgi:hypothetical protein
MYSVRGRNAATAATADHAVWGFWNPHSTQRIKLIALSMFAQSGAPASGYTVRLRRITARGTAGSTVTPNISNHSLRGAAPPSGVLLDLAAYSVQPTLEASSVDFGLGYTFANSQASGIVYPIPGGIEIGPGAGIAAIQVPATASVQFDISLSWLEDWL